MDFGHTGDAHDGRGKVAARSLLADELIEQPAEAREVMAGARRHDRSGDQMGGRMKADEVNPGKLWHPAALSYSRPAN